jgi:p24 family protein delta-1
MRALLFFISLHLTTALKFDLAAQPPASKNERCIRNFVNRDTLVVVTAILDGRKGDGQVVNMHVRRGGKNISPMRAGRGAIGCDFD